MAARQPLILLTGATGFVGRQVLRALIERNCRVRVVIRDGKQSQFAPSPAIESIVASPDIFAESAAWWADACRGVDTVIHVAWYAEPGAISSIAEKSGMPGGNAAACARARRRPRSAALSASAPALNTI